MTQVRERKPPQPSRALDFRQEEGYIQVKMGRYNFGKPIFETEDLKTIEVPGFTGPVARVKVTSSTTRNLGNFNSVKVEIGLDLPCYPVAGEIDDTYEKAADWVARKIEEELSEGGDNG